MLVRVPHSGISLATVAYRRQRFCAHARYAFGAYDIGAAALPIVQSFPGRFNMKRFLLVAVAATSLAAPALAADLRMPVKAPPPMIAPVATWTGFYIGANAGYSWGRARTDAVSVAVPGVAAIGVPGTGSLNLNGGVAGGQIGYNWQFSNWVWGLEGDGQWSGQRGSSTVICGATCTGTAAAGFAATFSQKIDAFGTFRGRVGFLATPDILLYGTGGLAVASFRSSVSAGVAAGPLVAG